MNLIIKPNINEIPNNTKIAKQILTINHIIVNICFNYLFFQFSRKLIY